MEAATNWDTMTSFACAHCEHRRNLTYHMKSKHPDVLVERKVRGAGQKVKTGLGFKCDQCAYEVWIDMSQGIIQIIQHSSVINVESHIQGLVIWRCIKGHVLDPLLLLLSRDVVRALGGASEMYEVDMKESDNFIALHGAVTSFQPCQHTNVTILHTNFRWL